jgi:hypothetical protein
LSVEVTKAINLIVDAVIEELDSFYRFDEGCVLLASGDGFQNGLHRFEYAMSHRLKESKPYVGMDVISRAIDRMMAEHDGCYTWGVLGNLENEISD